MVVGWAQLHGARHAHQHFLFHFRVSREETNLPIPDPIYVGCEEWFPNSSTPSPLY